MQAQWKMMMEQKLRKSTCKNGINYERTDKSTYKSLLDEEYQQNFAGEPFKTILTQFSLKKFNTI